jgi:light-regulated signal transduction histidine kinase (bacteriophytochrome)
LSFAALRSVSPVHLQYMRNMGTLASMSISILVESRLWGLISCHNAQPRQVNAQVRTACDLLGKVVSLQLTASEQGMYARRRIELKRMEVDLLARLASVSNFAKGLVENPGSWLELCGASGAAVLTDSALFTAGQTPSTERLRALAAVVRERHSGEVFACDALALLWPEFADLAPQASGVLAISISQLYPSYIMWFRPEVVRTVRWGGDPRKPAEPGTGLLNPRNSFEVWKEQVRLRAEPWSKAEVDGSAELRTAIINLVLLRAEERAALTSQLERSNRELESFSYSVSHDLRAPFRHIVGYTQLLRERERTLSEKSLHYLESINEAAITAGKLVDDLLNFSHLGRTSLTMHRTDMNKLTEEILRSLAPDIAGRDIIWHIGSLPAAFGDASLLRQALSNLIANAIKYSRGRSPAVIEIDGRCDDAECVYRVKDNGVGFDMAYVGKLFGVFQRLHRIEDFEGTGIGLALTKRVIERHGGWVRAEGAPNAGACFYFAIPIKAKQAHSQEAVNG